MWDPTGEAGVPTVREVASPVIGWYRRACGGGQSFSLFEMRTLNKFRAAQLRPSSSCFNLLWKVVVTLYNKSTTNRNEWCLSFNPFSLTLLLIVTKMSLPQPSAPYWSNPPFYCSDIRALWRPVLSARAPECQKLKMVG